MVILTGFHCTNNNILLLLLVSKEVVNIGDFLFCSDDLERYSQLQYMLLTDDTASLKVIEELLIQALVYRLMVFAYEVKITHGFQCPMEPYKILI